jgi:tight adherence protein C
MFSNPVLLIFALAVLGGVVYFGITAVRLLRSDDDALQDRLKEFGSREVPTTLEEIELSLPFSERVIRPIVRAMATVMMRFTPAQTLAGTQRSLDLAGNPNNWSPAEFWGIRIAAAIGTGLLFFLLFTFTSQWGNPMFIGIFLGSIVLGYMLPTMLLSSMATRRQANVLKALPDALDLLVICVEAGLGFEAAMAKVNEKWDNELSIAFGRVLQEVRLGKTRRDALRDMAKRLEVPDLTSFIAAMIQADQLGVSIGKVLRIQADQMRLRRRQRAERLAHEAPIKMLFPMVLLIFPSIFIILLGPAVLIILKVNPVGIGGG